MRAALLLVVLLAGCASAPPPAPADGLAWGIETCAFVIAVVEVDEAALVPHLPEGFAAQPGLLAPLPAGPRSALHLDAYRCARGTWGNATLEDMSYGSFYIPAAPPEELREEGYDATFVKLDALVAHEPTRARLAAAGLPARGGEARVSLSGPQVEASLVLDDGAGFALVGTMTEPEAQAAPLPFLEFTPATNGLARWHARLHDAAIGQGAGVVTIPEGWVREVVGAERAPATFIAGTWNLDEADVVLPS